MSQNGKGSFTADIPKSLLDEAVEAVERRQGAAGAKAEPGSGPEAKAKPAPGGEVGEAKGEPGSGPEAKAEPLSEVERLRAELEMSQAAGRESFQKLKEEHERFLRAAADLENYRKRAQREREEVQKFGIELLLKDLFPVVDNLDRALQAAPEGDPLAGGVKLVLKSLEEVLARHGVKSFRALGEPFDPKRHEAIATLPAADRPPGTVLAEHGRGFELHGRLVRPALVAVAAAPAEEGNREPEPG